MRTGCSEWRTRTGCCEPTAGTSTAPVAPPGKVPRQRSCPVCNATPQKLLTKIYKDTEGAGVSKDGEALVAIADVLRCGFVPADLRAALFQAATGSPGVDMTSEQANLDGRRGVAVGRDERSNGNHFRQNSSLTRAPARSSASGRSPSTTIPPVFAPGSRSTSAPSPPSWSTAHHERSAATHHEGLVEAGCRRRDGCQAS